MSFLSRAAARIAALFDETRLGSKILREYRLLAVLVGTAAVVALTSMSIRGAPRWLGVLGVLIGFLYYFVASRRERRRQQLINEPFPELWRETLATRVPLYTLLSPSERARFESEIQLFLGEQRIYSLRDDEGHEGPPLSDEHRLLIAASAATLLLGRPEWRLPTARDIVVYPTAFTEETYNVGPQPGDGRDPYGSHSYAIGMVHAQGPILLSLDALQRSFPTRTSMPETLARSAVGLSEPVLPHVGIHEFAHVLDFIGNDGRPHGVPGMLSEQAALHWNRQLHVERDRLTAGKSVLSPYGLKNEAELFAVAVESFFQDPLRLRVFHPELYGLLSEFFNQDPAARLVAHHAAFIFRPWFALGPTIRYTA